MRHPGLFGQWFSGPSWDGWEAIKKGPVLPADERGGDHFFQVRGWWKKSTEEARSRTLGLWRSSFRQGQHG
jgi:hypothetical protein